MGAVRTAAGVLGLLAGLWGTGARAESSTRTRVSANGVYGIRFTQRGPGSCTVEVLREQQTAWSLDTCVGTSGDLYFVSNTGERFWVLHTLPEKPAPRSAPRSRRGKKRAKPVDPLLTAEVASLFDRQGQVVSRHVLGEWLPAKGLPELRQLGHHFVWLEGVGGVPGREPRLTDAGEVEFEAVGQKTQKLTF